MKNKRKISLVVKKLSFSEAEEADDKYWAMASAEERLRELITLRKLFSGNSALKIKKAVSQRGLYEEEN